MKTILVVNDCAENREPLKEVLASKGYRVIEKGDAFDALAHSPQEPSDLVFADASEWLAEEDQSRECQEDLLLQAEQTAPVNHEWEASGILMTALLKQLPVGVIAISSQGKVIVANQALKNLLGSEVSLGHGLAELADVRIFLPDGRPMEKGQCPLTRSLMNGEIVAEQELHVFRKDNTWTILQSNAVPIRDSEGRVVAATMVLQDITESKQATADLAVATAALEHYAADLEERVAERTAKLMETVGDLEHFSYTITHDMRAPLRVMQGFGKKLLGECADCVHPERKDLLQRISQSAARMDSLITDALNYSKVLREKMELQPIDVGSLLKGMLESYPQFQSPAAEIQIMGGMPIVMGNEAGLTQCFSNLLNNAVKFVPKDTIPQVRIRAEERGARVRIWFEDNGIGIAKHHQETIFGMFQRLDKNYEGTGIGLALVKKVVERMQGGVGLESEEGKGSQFWVELRRCK